MPRVKRGQGHVNRRKNILKRVKGFGAGRKKLIKAAKMAAKKAGSHSYKDRKIKKRQIRALWQVKINAAARNLGIPYSRLIGLMKSKEIGIDRKALAQIAQNYPKAFEKIIEYVK
jgi:large subunit ribosomal protein L20